MNIIIVDDEPFVREGLKAIIDWNSYDINICAEASDGLEGYDKIMEYNPELVIIDIKMPEMSGIELTKKLRTNGFQGKIVILSGYSDFTYAQSALRFGVISYLLKPVDEQELLNIVLETKRKIENDFISNLYSNLSSDEALNTLLSNILTKTIKCSEIRLPNNCINMNANLYQLILIDYDLSPCPISFHLNEWKSNIGNSNRLVICIQNYIIILLIGQISIKYFSNRFKQLITIVNREEFCYPFILIGNKTTCFSDLPDYFSLYKSIALRKFFFFNETCILNVADIDIELNQISHIPFNFFDTVTILFESIKNNDTKKTFEYIDHLFLQIKYKEMASEQAVQLIINFIFELKNQLDQTYEESFITFNAAGIVNKICNCKYLIQISNLLKSEIAAFCRTLPESGESNIMQKVLNYLETHYNESIKLDDIAQLFNYNTSYLGKIFHVTTGEYFNYYLEKLRLDKAKELLRNEKLKNSEIANRVGYQNIEYFYKKFKIYTGKSPNQFRKSLLDQK